MIELKNINFAYPDDDPLFDGFSWKVEEGETWAVLGPSGCGKTSLLYLLAGLELPTQGEVVVGGRHLRRPRPETGLILQDYGLLPWATVRQNAELGLQIRGFYGPDGTHAPILMDSGISADPWLERLGIKHLEDKFPAQISGGERQRTAIARTLVLNPDLLLMDEPFASLDAPTRTSLQDLALTLFRENQLTSITVTHTIEEAAVLGEKILVLGNPPHRQAEMISNPPGGKPGFRGCSDYYQLCGSLEELMRKGDK